MAEAFALDLPPPPRPGPWGSLVSVGLHALLCAVLLWLSPLRPLIVPEPQPIAVEIVTPDQLVAPAPTASPPPVLAAPAASAAEVAPDTSTRLAPSPPGLPSAVGDGTVKATKFYAAAILEEPGMARIRKTFGTLAASEKLVQVCNIEGLEQIRRAMPQYDPDTLVPYATSDPLAAGLTLSAPGAAFRSRRKWYGMTFKCTAAADLAGVTAFEFKLGQPIPEAEWEADNLNAEDAAE